MKIEIKSVIHAGLESAMFAKRHIHALLFVVLIIVICAWGFIFWRYGYQAVFEREGEIARPLSIKKNELNSKRKRQEFKEKSEERISAIASYTHKLANTRENTSVEKYFGKKYLTYLRGEQIINKLRNAKENQKSQKANYI